MHQKMSVYGGKIHIFTENHQLTWKSYIKGLFRLRNFVSNFLVTQEKLHEKLQASAMHGFSLGATFLPSVLDLHGGMVLHAL